MITRSALLRNAAATGLIAGASGLPMPALASAKAAKIGYVSPQTGPLAVRDNQETARSVGVDARRVKAFVYLATAFVTGLVGALIYVQKARISPDAAFSVVDWTAYVIFVVVIGGIGTIEGPIVGVIVFFLLRNTFADYGSWYLPTLGLIGIAVMLFAPRGLWGLFADRTGIQFFPIRRTLRGGLDCATKMTQGATHG